MTASPERLHYPLARRSDHCETLRGRVLKDAFHWLEGPEEGEVAHWMAAEQALTDATVGSDPREQVLHQWLTAFLARPFVFHVFDAGAHRFMLEERPGAEQPVLLRSDGRVAIDPDAETVDGHPAILDQESLAASPDGRHIAFALKSADSVGMSLYVRDIESGTTEGPFPANVIPRVSWHPRGHGFFYNQCQGEFIAPEERAGRPDGVYWHALGTAIAADPMIQAKDWPEAHGAIPAVSDDGRFLFVSQIRLVADRCRLSALALDGEGRVTGAPMSIAPEAAFCFIGTVDGVHCFQTDLDAPNGRVVGFDLSRPDRPQMREVVAEQPQPLALSPRAVRAERGVVFRDRLYLAWLNGSAHTLREHDMASGTAHDLPLPTGSAIAGAGGDRFGRLSVATDGHLIVDLWRHAAPPASYLCDVAAGTIRPAVPSALPRTLVGVVTEEILYRSKDGTAIPMTILSLGPPARDRSRPCLLYGYGGWGMPIVPEFSLDIAAWLAMGGIYAIANIRGGGEFGAHWHEAGRGANKQNVFDDFIAAAEYIKAEGIAGRVAIRGLSNGGLLTGACVTQRPDLFAAVISELPLLDPLSMGRDHWSAQIAPELGNPFDDAGAFDTIARYSPLQALRDDVSYPPILVVAAEKDAQLLMDGARKFVATLQMPGRGGGPYLLHIVRDAAHGGWNKSQQLATTAREMAFLAQAMDIDTAALPEFGD